METSIGKNDELKAAALNEVGAAAPVAKETDMVAKKPSTPELSKPDEAKEEAPEASKAPSKAAAVGRQSRSSSLARHAMRNPKPPKNKTRDLLQIIAMSVISMTVTLLAMWWLDLLSSGRWEGHMVSRVIFTGAGMSIARDQLQTPTPLMPNTVVVFYSESCLHCVKMRSPFLRASNEFRSLRFVAVKLSKDHENNVQLAKSFGVTHVPTVYFTKIAINEEGLNVNKVKYRGGVQLWDLRKFINAQLAEDQGAAETSNDTESNDKEL